MKEGRRFTYKCTERKLTQRDKLKKVCRVLQLFWEELKEVYTTHTRTHIEYIEVKPDDPGYEKAPLGEFFMESPPFSIRSIREAERKE